MVATKESLHGLATKGSSLALTRVAEAFRMDEEEKARFARKPVARLIAALPFLAACRRPERTAIEHLGIYVLSVRDATRSAFFASPHDDESVFARLRPIMRFDGGNRRVVDRGMAVLARMMVADYRRDREVDRLYGKYNPVAAGAWDAEKMIAELSSAIETTPYPQIDEIMGDDDDTEAWWSWD